MFCAWNCVWFSLLPLFPVLGRGRLCIRDFSIHFHPSFGDFPPLLGCFSLWHQHRWCPHIVTQCPQAPKGGVTGKIGLFGSRNPEDPGGSECLEAPGGFLWAPRVAQRPGAAPEGFHRWFGLQILDFWSVLGSVPREKPFPTPQLHEGDKSGPAGVVPSRDFSPALHGVTTTRVRPRAPPALPAPFPRIPGGKRGPKVGLGSSPASPARGWQLGSDGQSVFVAVTSLPSLSAPPTALSPPAAGTFLGPTKVPELLPRCKHRVQGSSLM